MFEQFHGIKISGINLNTTINLFNDNFSIEACQFCQRRHDNGGWG